MFSSITQQSIMRFLQYAMVGGGTFLLDLGFLFLGVTLWGIDYVLVTPIAFLVAVSIHFWLSYQLVFSKTSQPLITAYRAFMAAMATSAGIITVLMYIVVSLLGVDYLIARIIVGCVVGVGNYLFHLHISFRVAGRH